MTKQFRSVFSPRLARGAGSQEGLLNWQSLGPPTLPGKTSAHEFENDWFKPILRCQTQWEVSAQVGVIFPHPPLWVLTTRHTAPCGVLLSCARSPSRPLGPKERGALACPPQLSILTRDCHSSGSGIALHPRMTVNMTRSCSRSSSRHPGRKSALVTSRCSDL